MWVLSKWRFSGGGIVGGDHASPEQEWLESFGYEDDAEIFFAQVQASRCKLCIETLSGRLGGNENIWEQGSVESEGHAQLWQGKAKKFTGQLPCTSFNRGYQHFVPAQCKQQLKIINWLLDGIIFNCSSILLYISYWH